MNTTLPPAITQRDFDGLATLAWADAIDSELLWKICGGKASLRTYQGRNEVLIKRDRLVGKGKFNNRVFYFLRHGGVEFLRSRGVDAKLRKITDKTICKYLARSTFCCRNLLDGSGGKLRRLLRQSEATARLRATWTKARDRCYFEDPQEEGTMLSLFVGGVEGGPSTLLDRIRSDATKRAQYLVDSKQPTNNAANLFIKALTQNRFRWAVACPTEAYREQLMFEAERRNYPVKGFPPEKLLHLEVMPELAVYCVPEVRSREGEKERRNGR